MTKDSIRYAAIVLIVMSLIGIISQAGPPWLRYTALTLGVAMYLLTFLSKQEE